MKYSIRWQRSQDGYVTSRDGRWSITPEYYGGTRAMSYAVRDLSGRWSGSSSGHDTQHHAKLYVEELLRKERV